MENLLKNVELEMKKVLKFMSLGFEKINVLTTRSEKLFDTKNKFLKKEEKMI